MNRKSPAAQALYGLGKKVPDFAPLLDLMRDDVRSAGLGTHSARMFLSESANLGTQEVTDASTFTRLCSRYLDSMKQARDEL